MILNMTKSKFSEFDKTFFFFFLLGARMLVCSYTHSSNRVLRRFLSVGSKCSCCQSESRSYMTTFTADSSLVDSKYHNIMCPTGTVNGPQSHILSPTKIKDMLLFCDLPAEKRVWFSSFFFFFFFFYLCLFLVRVSKCIKLLYQKVVDMRNMA